MLSRKLFGCIRNGVQFRKCATRGPIAAAIGHPVAALQLLRQLRSFIQTVIGFATVRLVHCNCFYFVIGILGMEYTT